MRYQGRISVWREDKAFGFITPSGAVNQVFVHIKSFSDRRRTPEENELVTYELMTDAEGRDQAYKVKFSREFSPLVSPIRQRRTFPALSIIFLTLVAVLAFFNKLPLIVLVLYLSASFITYFVYMHDKSAAEKNQQRVSENRLHLFALIGGWPGALAAQMRFRHKTKKQSFQNVFWVTTVLNCCALAGLLSPSGVKFLRSIIVAL